ncbi:FapA family protein [Massilia sp. PAMC28688]|uniref:flagellar assembly protein A n=1 Tax=Massilia sp. PAMC28688 TaxID=2861283 RepID=UPI001C634395|nr:flagellar assembly protein A [Massilia sp. PAMC28688]QYF92454.1 FapA family protein [Massilia sp. PAMC28688]
MSIEPSAVSSERPAAGVPGPGVANCMVQRADGVYADASVLGTTIAAAVDSVFAGERYFAGLDYAILLKLIYNHGPDLKATGEVMVRLADDIVPFDPERRQLYRAVKLSDGKAEYQFEPVVIVDKADPYGAGTPARLDMDEFIADMWSKGIRFGIDIAALGAAIASGKTERVTVARRLDPVPGIDAHIIEVSSDLHRSDAPRQLANGKLDLMAFQNRFPQIKEGVRLLKKVARQEGKTGFQLSGIAIEPPIPKDIELSPMAGPGTAIEIGAEGEFLVSTQSGFLNADSKTHQLSVGDKIVSRDGVSSRTTGNLQLTGDYEEFGEVQEKRVIEGESVTIHADVFGNIISRGGTILLNHNLVGGSAHNARGDIRIKGVASGSVMQTSVGEVHVQRAESCIISGTRVVIDYAANCEIMADEVIIAQAEGCAIAARRIEIETAGPRKQAEMQLFVLEPDSARLDEAIAAVGAKASEFGAAAERSRAEMEALTSEPEVRKYVMLASKIRKNELTLTPEQAPQFQKMAASVAPALKAIAKVSLEVKAAETEQNAAMELVEQLVQQRKEYQGLSQVSVAMLSGDTALRSMTFNPDGSTLYDLPAKEIKSRLRGNTLPSEPIISQSSGKIVWQSK